MSATFTFKITGLRTQTVNGIENAVKQVDWTLIGTEADQVFELPQSTTVPDPQSEGFIPLENLTEAQVVAWVETHDARIPSIQAHIQSVLDREVAQAQLAPVTVPWAPVEPITEATVP